ncbi:hypothetical protein CEXT_747251 [Caerostris extrusa]|uniref:Uncharacterized protein n=1 Tax=Caerostris extrusa TaxID=172846 RepID=A0AAV4XN52_CAEEX|nr:hypothetical protein CEXT_747251 [Caerostris extrusa]
MDRKVPVLFQWIKIINMYPECPSIEENRALKPRIATAQSRWGVVCTPWVSYIIMSLLHRTIKGKNKNIVILKSGHSKLRIYVEVQALAPSGT